MTTMANHTVTTLLTAILLHMSVAQLSAAAPEFTVFNDNGSWCWFQDERAIVSGDRLVFASVANALGTDGVRRGGNIEVTTVDLTGRTPSVTTVLHAQLQNDDHAAPALLVLDDGRILAMYGRHGSDQLVRFRVSVHPGDATSWQPERHFPREASVTYSNLFLLRSGEGGKARIYNFYRGEHWNPNWMTSDDMGQTWRHGGRLIAFDGRPYAKYASNGLHTIHFVTTEHHPHNYANSLYHGYMKAGSLYRSDGTVICDVNDAPIRPVQATTVFAGDVNHVAWPCDMHLDASGNPYIVYSVQKQLDPNHIRYRYARWDGCIWNDCFLAHAGTALYAGGSISGMASPRSPIPTGSTSPRMRIPSRVILCSPQRTIGRHYESSKGRTGSRRHVELDTITCNSTADNIRRSCRPGMAPERLLCCAEPKQATQGTIWTLSESSGGRATVNSWLATRLYVYNVPRDGRRSRSKCKEGRACVKRGSHNVLPHGSDVAFRGAANASGDTPKARSERKMNWSTRRAPGRPWRSRRPAARSR
jgi:hypothetical protein